MPRACTAARCSSDCGIQPSSAATVNSTAGTGPTPASMLGTKRSCPGTSTNASRSPDGSVSQAEPQVDGQATAPFLGPPVRLHPGQRADQGGLAVVHVPGGRDHLHGVRARRAAPARPAPRRPAASSSAGRHRAQVEQQPAALGPADHGRELRRCAPAGRPQRHGQPGGQADRGAGQRHARGAAAADHGRAGAPPGHPARPSASRLASCRARRASDGSSAASAVASGAGGPVSVASSAAAVVLSTRSARASGCRASWRTRRPGRRSGRPAARRAACPRSR